MSGHRRLKRVIAGIVVLLVIVIAGLYASFPLLVGAAPAPLALPSPSTASGQSASSIEGTWIAGTGSIAGYRVRAAILGQGADVVGRTSAVSGNVVLTETEVVSASLGVDLTTLEQGGKPQPQLAKILDTGAHRDATFTLTAPIALGSTPVIGKAFTVSTTGLLAMHGTSRSVAVTLMARYDGASLAVAGSIPVLFSDWGIEAPWGLEDHGAVEFLLVLARSN